MDRVGLYNTYIFTHIRPSVGIIMNHAGMVETAPIAEASTYR